MDLMPVPVELGIGQTLLLGHEADKADTVLADGGNGGGVGAHDSTRCREKEVARRADENV